VSPHDPGGPDIWIPPGIDPKSVNVMKTLPDETEVRGSNAMMRLTEAYIEAHPTYILSVAYWNSIRLFDLRGPSDALNIAPYIPYNDRLVYLSVYSSYLVDVLVVVGCFTRRARRMPWYFWSTPLLLYLGLILVSGNIRYRSVIEPFIVLLASLAIASACQWWLPQSAHSEQSDRATGRVDDRATQSFELGPDAHPVPLSTIETHGKM
jgi:hypothetical protein